MTIKRFFLDRVVKWGTPWHGKMIGSTIHLPNAQTRTGPGDSQYAAGGDFFKVQVPGQSAATTTAAETSEGKEWLNYGIISGANHLFYGKLLGERSWLYVAEDKSIWLVVVYFPGATAEISFKRFGLVGYPESAIEQTINITPAWTTVKSLDVIQDISLSGNRVIWSHRDASAPASAMASRRRETMIQGLTLLTISGIPPSATATWTIEKTESDCVGSVTNTRYAEYIVYYQYGTVVAGNGVLSSSIVCDSYMETVPYGSTLTPTAPSLPSGMDFVGDSRIDPYTAPSDFLSSVRVGYYGQYGLKSVTGIITGAVFSDSGAIEYVTIDVVLNDASSDYRPLTIDHPLPGGIDFGEYWVGSIGYFMNFGRTGSFKVKKGSITIIDADLKAEYTSTINAYNSWECTSLNYKVGDFFSDTNAANQHVYFSNAGSPLLDVDSNSTHLIVAAMGGTLGPYGATDSMRLIPARYANHCYGLLTAHGSVSWTLSPWSEVSTPTAIITEQHQAFSANGSSSVMSSWTGTTSGTSGVQHSFASSNPVSNNVAISSSSNVCFV